jgi:hypothetical protein
VVLLCIGHSHRARRKWHSVQVAPSQMRSFGRHKPCYRLKISMTMRMSISAGRRRPGRNASEQSFFKWRQLGLRSLKGAKLPQGGVPRSYSVSIEATAEAE